MTVDGVGVFYALVRSKRPRSCCCTAFPLPRASSIHSSPLLATRYHLTHETAGFGQSDAPPPSSYRYTFDNFHNNGLLEQLKINKYTFYLHDYGGPVGFRIISAHPDSGTSIQNANAYKEGLGTVAGVAQSGPLKAYPEVFDAFVSLRHNRTASHPRHLPPRTL